MNQEEVVNKETLVDIRIFGIPETDLDYWLQIVRINGGNRKSAFKMLLDCYAFSTLIGQLNTKIQSLEERLETVEQKWRQEGGNLGIKTFGGGKI